MKREIKFRYYIQITTLNGPTIHKVEYTIKEIEERIFTHNEDIVLDKVQFTGLKDKNGVEIYDGDIVSLKGMKSVGRYATEVIYNRQGFTVKENKSYINNDCVLALVKVIGNIYQNKELLK